MDRFGAWWWSSVIAVLLLGLEANAQLSSSFYSSTCPNLTDIVRNVIQSAVANENRMAASILRLHFHDCFVNGCDGSVLLQGGEENAPPNQRSARGFEVIDSVKSAVESACPGVVSCADILALSAHESVTALGGPSWTVVFGRRDSLSPASVADVSANLPGPGFTALRLIRSFQNQDLSPRDLVALSGGHTIGQAQCFTFRARLYNGTAGDSIDPALKSRLEQNCPPSAPNGDRNLENLDTSPATFDNTYFQLLQSTQGLLFSDQQLLSGGQSELASMVNEFAGDQQAFFTAFANGMVSMGNLSPLTGSSGEIRATCRSSN